MKAAFLGRLVGAVLLGVAMSLLVQYGEAMTAQDYGSMTREEILEQIEEQSLSTGECFAIGLGMMGFAFIVMEFFGFVFAHFAGTVTPPPRDLPPLPDDRL